MDLVIRPFSPKALYIQGRLAKAIMWVLWKEKNMRAFEEENRETRNRISDVHELLYDWAKRISLFRGAN